MGVRVNTGPLEEALAFLFARTTGGVRFGLERTIELLDKLGNPHRAYPVVHVAGTNGKGSSLATAEALLRARGLRVGKYTSPHLVDFRERIIVGGVPIEGDAVVEFVDRWIGIVEALGATFFEVTTAMAFDWFARAGVDVALIETGLGGRLDSTNVVDPIAAGVTTIGWDHMEYLGNTLEAIAGEKAGIFKRGRPAVIGERVGRLRMVLEEHARAVGAKPVIVGDEIDVRSVDVSAAGTVAMLAMGGDVRRVRTPLTGRHQAANLAFTLALLDAAGPEYRFSLAQAEPLLGAVSLPGRFQRFGKYIFDVAHNRDGALVLAETLGDVAPQRPIAAVFCALKDKDWHEMISELRGVVDRFVFTNAPTAPASRAWNLDDVARHAADTGIAAEIEPDFAVALERASTAGTVVVTGSFHTVGDAMARLQVSPLGS
ncbi:MAG TPA: folylpolyglutamate synthase/dihydrofolate synthase family protein [Gemmatimonadaceae bacterium]|nr:folylpolyglutamate synthase/dihydrofolate synthase family protein [Gemmatimonadaceae bacterium]